LKFRVVVNKYFVDSIFSVYNLKRKITNLSITRGGIMKQSNTINKVGGNGPEKKPPTQPTPTAPATKAPAKK